MRRLTDAEIRREIERLAKEVNEKYVRIKAERDRLGLKPGESLLGLRLEEE